MKRCGRRAIQSHARASPIRFQLGGRLKAIYGSDQAPMPDAMRNLLMRIEACLQSRK